MSRRLISPTAPAPAEKTEWDVSKMTPQELKLYKLYGKLPSRNELVLKKLKDRKYFDLGDYAMSKVRNQLSEGEELENSEGAPSRGSCLPKKIPEDDFITSDVDGNQLPLPDVEKIINLQKKKSISRHGLVISTVNREMTGVGEKLGLEKELK